MIILLHKPPMTTIDVLGFVAGILTTFNAIPQLVRIVRSQSADDLSYVSLIVLCVGLTMWSVYGALLDEVPIILWNVAALGVSGSVLGAKAFFAVRARQRSLRDLENCLPTDSLKSCGG